MAFHYYFKRSSLATQSVLRSTTLIFGIHDTKLFNQLSITESITEHLTNCIQSLYHALRLAHDHQILHAWLLDTIYGENVSSTL